MVEELQAFAEGQKRELAEVRLGAGAGAAWLMHRARCCVVGCGRCVASGMQIGLAFGACTHPSPADSLPRIPSIPSSALPCRRAGAA